MKPAILVFLLLFTTAVHAQFNELVLRKNGIAKKRYAEGASITLQTNLGLRYTGTIYLIQNDSIYFAGGGIHKRDVAIVYKKQKKITALSHSIRRHFYTAIWAYHYLRPVW